jgi:hypothetical protein
MTRLGFNILERAVEHRPMNALRLRRRTAEYAAVLHFPKHAQNTFTPFILPRVETLIGAKQRGLRGNRGSK